MNTNKKVDIININSTTQKQSIFTSIRRRCIWWGGVASISFISASHSLNWRVRYLFISLSSSPLKSIASWHHTHIHTYRYNIHTYVHAYMHTCMHDACIRYCRRKRSTKKKKKKDGQKIKCEKAYWKQYTHKTAARHGRVHISIAHKHSTRKYSDHLIFIFMPKRPLYFHPQLCIRNSHITQITSHSRSYICIYYNI